jgi:mono/diheme cytochrome c family protein
VNSLYDLILPAPIPGVLIDVLMFSTFFLHLLFVLMMLGTAILGMAYFIFAWRDESLSSLRWDKRILRMFMVHKSLAVVLGVGPLLLIQVGYTIPFFTAVSLFSPFWLLVIAFLIVAFLSFDSISHRIYTHRYIHLGLGILAMIALLAIPGFFVAVLVTTENPGKWNDIIRSGFGFDWRISVHWLFRYLHVLGAAIVFGGAFHYFFITWNNKEKSRVMLKWMLGGLLFQVPVGVLLFSSLFQKPTAVMYCYLGAGIILTGLMIWTAAISLTRRRSAGFAATVTALLLLLGAMLLFRQGLQDRGVAPLMRSVRRSVGGYRSKLAKYDALTLERYRHNMSIIYDNGPTIFRQSCSFCHGENARGDGPDAHYLHVPPEDITAIRATKGFIRSVLEEGVDGSAMPRFTYYDDAQRGRVLGYLDKEYGILRLPGPVPVRIAEGGRKEAESEWKRTCSSCHGENGRGTATGASLRPPPPDFSRYSLAPHRAFKVITNGYPGTAMASFSDLPEGVRWGLVEVVSGKREGAGEN